jgi:uncharacterized protein DUF4157
VARPSFTRHLHAPVSDEREPAAAPAPQVELARPVYATQVAVDDVVARLATPAAHDELGGTEVDPTVVTTLRRRAGGGRALDQTGAALGAAIGLATESVRVHADQESDTIARSMQAKAFTFGRDIYFTQGSYDTSSAEGKHVLAHELGHVAQGRAGAYGGSPVIGRADDPAERDADRLADLALASLGAPGPVATVPDDVHEGRELPTVRRLFGKVGKAISKVKDKVNTFFGKAKPVDDEEVGDDYVDDMSHEERLTHQRRARGSGPGENPDFSDVSLWGQQPNRFVVTLAAAQEDVSWMNNVKQLKKAAISELISSPKKFAAGMSDAEERLAKKVLLKQGKLDNKTEVEIQQLVEKFAGSIHDVGHTWVRLQTYVAPTTGSGKKAKPSGKGKLKDLYSYGMWPQKLYDPANDDWSGGYSGPLSVGPGEVKHPDLAHEDDPTKVYRDYEVTATQFDNALGTAIDRYKSPPPYVLTGYNCTAFAREIVKAAGQTYPGSGILPGFAYTPGNLYWAVMEEWAKGNPAARTMEQEEEAMKKVKTRHATFGEAGKKNVDDEYKTAKGIPLDLDDDTESEAGEVSLRQQFLDAGLQLYVGNGGGFKPPTGLDDTVSGHATLAQVPLIQVQRQEGEWVEIVLRGDFHWVHEEHLALFQNPTRPDALFDDEGSEFDDDSESEDLLEVPTSSSPEVDDDLDVLTAEDKLPYALEGWKRLGLDISNVDWVLPYTIEDDIKLTSGELCEVLEGPNAGLWAKEIAEALGCEVEDVMQQYGPSR